MKKRKIVSDKRMGKVDIRALDGLNYVYIYLNEKVVRMENHNSEGTYNAFEYDYNEFVAREKEVDINDVRKNPEKYLNYIPTKNISFEELQTDFNIDMDYRMSMLELGLI